VSQKTVKFFCHNFVKFSPTLR